MKTIAFLLSFLVFIAIDAFGQGHILLSNVLKPTRLYTIDGPLAGPGIWGQFFMGESVEGLSPFWTSGQHASIGVVNHGDVEVPNMPAYTGVYVQFWAWDGTVWGTDYRTVPMDQFGMTDTVPYLLWDSVGYIEVPRFTQPAVVPPVPEPSVWALFVLGSGLALYRTRRQSKERAS